MLSKAEKDLAALCSHVEWLHKALYRALKREIDRDREIEVLTQERDNALLRIEELEAILEDADPNDRLYRGGVHPNA